MRARAAVITGLAVTGLLLGGGIASAETTYGSEWSATPNYGSEWNAGPNYGPEWNPGPNYGPEWTPGANPGTADIVDGLLGGLFG